MMRKLIVVLILAHFTLFSVAQGFRVYKKDGTVVDKKSSEVDSVTFYTSYTNPVRLATADPTCIKGEDGYFYLYCTGGKVNIIRSRNLADWEFVGTAFTNLTRPNFITYDDGTKPQLWAPDINKINGKYVMYYALHTDEATPKSGIGVAVADKPEGPFTDKGKLLRFDESPVNQKGCIDPEFVSAEGHNYLFWGSFQGINYVELTEDGLSLKDGDKAVKTQVCGTVYEGTYILKRGDYYYFFGSRGNTLPKETTKYRVVVGRSKSVTGPYLNHEGKDMKTNPAGYLLVQGNDDFLGPGHNGEVFTDKNGQDWIIYHAYINDETTISRNLMLDRLDWTEDGWPVLNNGNGPTKGGEAPEFD